VTEQSVEMVAPTGDVVPSRLRRLMSGGAGRNIGLVIAFAVLCVVGVSTAGERFASVDNVMTILRLAAVIGVLSIGMTFVITGGGIDLSVGSVLGLASVWATTLATQTLAEDTHWIVMVFTALVVGTVCGLINGALIAYGKVVAFIATLAMMVAARGLAEMIANRQTQIVDVAPSSTSSAPTCSGCPCWSGSSRWSRWRAGCC